MTMTYSDCDYIIQYNCIVDKCQSLVMLFSLLICSDCSSDCLLITKIDINSIPTGTPNIRPKINQIIFRLL